MQPSHNHDLTTEILSQIAMENGKTLERIMHLLLVKQNRAIAQRFREILEEKMPQNFLDYFDC